MSPYNIVSQPHIIKYLSGTRISVAGRQDYSIPVVYAPREENFYNW